MFIPMEQVGWWTKSKTNTENTRKRDREERKNLSAAPYSLLSNKRLAGSGHWGGERKCNASKGKYPTSDSEILYVSIRLLKERRKKK